MYLIVLHAWINASKRFIFNVRADNLEHKHKYTQFKCLMASDQWTICATGDFETPSDSEQSLIHSTCPFYSPLCSLLPPPPPEPLRLTNCTEREREKKKRRRRCKVWWRFKGILTARFRRRLCPGRSSSARRPQFLQPLLYNLQRCHFPRSARLYFFSQRACISMVGRKIQQE